MTEVDAFETREDQILLSVRGEAASTVDPDVGTLRLSLSVIAGGKAEASIEAGRAVEAALSGLAALGGEPRTAETAKAPLTWSTTSVSSYREMGNIGPTGGYGPTGRHVSGAQIEIRVRDYSLLEALQAVLDGHDTLQLLFVNWQVDPTNPAWQDVRSGAIKDAVRRARDYAGALGGRLVRIQHVADLGLLGANQPLSTVRLAAAAPVQPQGGPAAPHLDPAPQLLTAAIEARFIAVGVDLAGL